MAHPTTKILEWLLQCHRGLYLAAPEVPSPEILPPWAQDVGMEEFQIDYEPRCLAVSSYGPRVMVGTKAGSIYLVVWDEGKNRWWMEREWKGRRDRDRPLGAIRAVAMLDDRTLVAGLDAGRFRVLRLGDKPENDTIQNVPQESNAREDRSWLNRYSRLIRLHPQNEVPEEGDLVLGLSLGARVHLLSRQGGHYRVVSGDPESVPFLQWRKDWGRVIDATWSHQSLWLLSSRGRLLRYWYNLDKRTLAPSLDLTKKGEPIQLKYQRRGGAFRGLSSCIMGLAVLASDHVAFLRYQFIDGEPAIDPDQTHWFSVPDAIDCTVCLPYARHSQQAERAQFAEDYLRDPENPVWTVVTTGKSQLHWVAWPDFPRDSTSSWLPWQAPALFTNVGKGALYARFGWPLSGSPPFLVVGTRDHQLRIVSVLNRRQCEEAIESMVTPQDAIEISGAELWNLQQWIKSDFSSLRSTTEQEWTKSRRLLSGITEDNLRILVVTVFRAWEKAQRQDQEQQQLAKALMTDWMLRLLQRAYEFGPEVARDLARSAYDRITARRRDEGDRIERWNQLGIFAGFLRKWVLRGYTYEEKPVHLRDLYEWNRDCERRLDALAYLTRLFRRRVDPEWTMVLSEGGSAPAVWSIAACPPGSRPQSPFVVVSFTDGNLSAFSHKGQRLPWRVAPTCTLDRLDSEFLEIDPQEWWLRHKDTQDFREKYRHGPYARRLLLIQQKTEEVGPVTSYLLFFQLRGWRSQDRDRESRKPRVCALSIRPKFQDNEIEAILIEGLDSKPLDEELYALCNVTTPARPPGAHLILAGTNGTVKEEGSGNWISCPFREIEVVSVAGSVKIVVRSAPVYLIPKGQRSLFRNNAAASEDTAYNPCWVLVCSRASPEGMRVWGGFQDGSIRGFQRQSFAEEVNGPSAERANPYAWHEGGWTGGAEEQSTVSSDPPRQTGFKVAAAVWSLHVITYQNRVTKQNKRYLAYGTGDGTLGMVDLDDIEGKNTQEFCHLIHTREGSPISNLIDYNEDEGKRLLAVTQQGTICIFSLDFGKDFLQGPEDVQGGETDLSHRFIFPGLRLDHFSLRHSARAMVRMDSCESIEGPRLLIGSVEGSIHQHHLRYPRKSFRREEARKELEELMPSSVERDDVTIDSGDHSELERAVGKKNALAWLRVLDLSDLNLVKFSLWRDLLDRDPRATHPPDSIQVQRYIEHLHRLADEVYGRRPFSSEPAKVLWEVTGRFANQILQEALRDKGRAFGESLDSHRDLAMAIDDLSNRWIGFHQSFEAKVLIHSFEAFFDWTHIVLIAGDHGEAERVALLRKLLLHKVVQRRLYHSDSVVALETLRILNSSMVRAIKHARPKWDKQGPIWEFGLREGGTGSLGFYDLMTMVGDLAERLHDSLVPANPFSTEIIRFFALSLLLVPDSALIIGQVVSESRLTERGNGLANAISRQAEEFENNLGIDHDANLDRAIRRFVSYCSTDTELDLLEHWPDYEHPRGAESPWLFLLREALQSTTGKTPSDEEFAGELKHVLVLACWLSRLDEPERGASRTSTHEGQETDRQTQAHRVHESRNRAIREALRWLRQPEDGFRYFKHSAFYLKRLKNIREEVRELAGLTGTNPSIKKALTRCEEESKRIDDADLFQPQRTHCKEVIRSWHGYLVQRADRAVRVLDIIDEFNRHVYRTSADNLMTSIIELAMQDAPFSYYERLEKISPWKGPHDGPIRRLVHKRLEGNPLTREVFERADLLVDYTHLSGTLLEVARDHLGRDSELSKLQIEEYVTGEDIKEEIERERAARGLVSLNSNERWWKESISLSEVQIRGTRATWNAIIQEYARNISRYCHNLRGTDSRSRNGPTPFLKAAIHEQCVLISGSIPFLDSLSLDTRTRNELIDKNGNVDVQKTKKLIISLWEPRNKIHHHEVSNSSGMGLYLIQELSALCGLELELILFDPVEELAAYSQKAEKEEQRWPLCLKVTQKTSFQ